MSILKPKLFKGEIFTDERGAVAFVNGFKFPKIKRFYIVESKIGWIRGWHAHKYESKFVLVIQGSIAIGVIRIKNWKNPSKKLKVKKYILNNLSPRILYIPKGYANGFISLLPNTKVIFFSDRTLRQSKEDDYRYNEDYWQL